jgi:hypothetical protein
MIVDCSEFAGMFSASSTASLPICPICREPVALESAKTDEAGRAIHEDCYYTSLKRSAQERAS